MIQAEHLQKIFRVRKRNAGFKNAAKAFFSREYEEIHALNDVSFRIEDGEAVGYIGPNGAGKSSTIKILSGILTPDSGTCVIDGRVPWKDRRAHVSQIGVVFGQRSQLWWDVPVIDSFELIRDIYAVTEDVYKRNLRDLTDLLNLSELLKTPARSLSLGQRMRCEIAASLLHDPRILFLDEPTIGLDAVSKIAVREFVLDMNKRRGTTVILTTHDMQDVEALAQRVLLIGKGRILLDGTLDDIRRGGSGQIDETLAELFFRGFDMFNRMIGNGEFDRVLVRPRNEIFLVLCSRMDLERFGKGIMAIFLLIWALQNCPIDWCAARVMTLIFMILGGIVLFAGVYLIFAGLCFFTLEGLEFINILTDGMREHGRYPLSVYGKGVLTFCTYIVPYALVQYYPLMYLIGRHNDARAMLLPVIACVFIVPCYLFWKFGVRHYRSTGS